MNHGIQLWAALPLAQEEADPSFVHTPAAAIPQVRVGDATVRVLIGDAFGHSSPVATSSRTLYLDVQMPAGATLEIPPLVPEMAVYAVDAPADVNGQALASQSMLVLEPSQPLQLAAPAERAVRLMVIGGDPLDAPRHIWWNFVSSRKERIVQAARDWENDAMGQVPGDAERIPLPERRFKG